MTHSFSLWLSRLAVLSLLLTVSLSCKKNDDSTAAPKTITDKILEDSQFSLLRAAMTYAGAGDALKAANLTLFAPNDAAFQASGITSEAMITAMTKDQVNNLLLYHVLYGAIPSTAIPSGLNTIQAANQGIMYINKTSGGTVYVNNAKITQPDIQAANGYIHVIDRVLTPSAGSILTTIDTNPNLTFLSAAIKRIVTTNPTFVSNLSSGSSNNLFTFFAPNDDAFKAAGYKTLANIDAAPQATLASIISYHVLSGVSLTYQIQTGSVNTLSSGNKLTLTANNGVVTVKGAKNATAATIKTPDLVATNGVLHIIDQVLLP